MRAVTKDLGSDRCDYKIIPLGDLHIGSPKCRLSDIKKLVDDIIADEHTYVVLMGDLVNMGTKNSVGAYQDEISIKDQINLIISILQPLADNGRILCAVQGNHEERAFKESGIDLTAIFMKQFGLLDSYDPTGIVLFLKYGHFCHANGGTKGGQAISTMYITHGSAGGKMPGAKANALQKKGEIVPADIVCVAHSHLPLVFKEDRYELNTNGLTVKRKETLFINTNAWLDYEPYAERIGCKPSNGTVPIITLSGEIKKKIRVTL